MRNARGYVLKAADIALRTRQSLGYDLQNPICIYDAVEKLGVDLWFYDISGLEGMYAKAAIPKIIIGSRRPSGRKVFNCAHELGHHILKHGSRIDEIKNDILCNRFYNPEEFLADCFAGFFLMPKTAVEKAFFIRGWSPNACSPVEIFTIAGWFGVSYEAIIHHMSTNLGLLTFHRAQELKKIKPKNIRALLIGRDVNENIVPIDRFWTERAIDIQVSDFVFLPKDSVFEGKCAEFVEGREKIAIYRGSAPGVGRFTNSDESWTSFIRVSRLNYSGRGIYRHEEKPEDEV